MLIPLKHTGSNVTGRKSYGRIVVNCRKNWRDKISDIPLPLYDSSA